MSVGTNSELRCTIALAALHDVIDPEIGLNVVDLGLIYRIDFDGAELVLTMTLTTPYCPMGESITSAAKRVLEETFSTNVRVLLCFDPMWSSERISEVGKKFLSL